MSPWLAGDCRSVHPCSGDGYGGFAARRAEIRTSPGQSQAARGVPRRAAPPRVRGS